LEVEMGPAKQRVLVIEGDEMTLRRWLGALARADIEAVGEHTLHGARTHLGAAAWREEPFDCVLLDLRLSDGSGLELLGALDSLEPAPGVGIVSSSVDNIRALTLVRRGIAFLLKPISPGQLIELVSELRLRQLAPLLFPLGYRSVRSYADAFGLSERERRVLDHCVAGHGREETAAALGIGAGSVHRLWQRILARTGNATQDSVLRQVIRHVTGGPDLESTSFGLVSSSHGENLGDAL
jgi:FixJ family two-component response regulator